MGVNTGMDIRDLFYIICLLIYLINIVVVFYGYVGNKNCPHTV